MIPPLLPAIPPQVSTREVRWIFLKTLVRYGIPTVGVGFLGGVGDDLLSTSLVYELSRRGCKKIWVMARFPELFFHNPAVSLILPEDPRWLGLFRKLKRPFHFPNYGKYNPATDQDSEPERHIMAEMCAVSGIKGKVSLKPHIYFSSDEVNGGAIVPNQVAVQSSSLTASVAMKNKQWFHEHFQSIVDALRREFNFVQIGASTDPKLEGAIDLRGRTNLRETAALLRQSRMFVGLVGFLMHLARATDCPSVIVYGGRETPAQSGYPCNFNLTSQPPCSPCWLRNRCDYDRICLTSIEPSTAIAAIQELSLNPRGPLTLDTFEIQ